MIHYKPKDLFHNRYRLIEHVAFGGMSQVWTAKDEHGDEDEVIALKIYDNNADRKSLSAEYALMRKFNHPNLLRPDYFGADESTDSPFMVMKYYSKGSATKIINDSNIVIKAIEEKLIAQFILSATRALITIQAHERKIIHQDIKPDNFLINDDDSFVLADFGVSTISKETKLINPGNGQFAGSTAYVAPERFNGAPPRFSQDIFSLGITIYEILTGVLPFQDNGGQRLNQGFSVPDLDPTFGYSSRLNALCKRCMDLEPEARPLTSELLNWTEFYLKNGYWPEIPFVDVAAIKAEKLFNSSKLIYNRIVDYKLNEIDTAELETCIKNYQELIQKSHRTEDASRKLKDLDFIHKEIDNLHSLENELKKIKLSQSNDEDNIERLKIKFVSIKPRLSSSFYIKVINDIEQVILKSSKSNKLAKELSELLNKTIYDLDVNYALSFVKQNKFNDGELIAQFTLLEEKIKKATEFNELKQDCDTEILKQLHLINNAKIEFCLFKLLEHNNHLGSSYLLSIEDRLENSRLCKSLAEELSSIKKKIEIKDNSITELKSILAQLNVLIKKTNQLFELEENNKYLAELFEQSNEIKSNLKEAISSAYLKENDKGTEISLNKKKAEQLANEAEKLFYSIQINSSAKLQLQLKNISIVIQKYEDSLILYKNEKVQNDLSIAINLKKQIEKKIKDEEESNKYKTVILTETIKTAPIALEDDKRYIIKLEEADDSFEIVDLFIFRKNFTLKTLNDNLKIIEEAINKYSEALSFSPRDIGKKRKKALDLKEIILEELRKKRRGVIFWFLKGAAVFGIIMVLYLNYNKSEKIEIAKIENNNQETRGNQPVVTDDNKPVDQLETKPVVTDDNKPVDQLETKPVVTGDNKPIDQLENKPVDLDDNKAKGHLETKPVVKDDSKPNKVDYSDFDKDGILDKDDKCPTIPGDNAHFGCPTPPPPPPPPPCKPEVPNIKPSYVKSKKNIELKCVSSCNESDISYEWIQTRGDNCVLSGQYSQTLIISKYDYGEYEFRLVKKNTAGVASSPYFFIFRVTH